MKWYGVLGFVGLIGLLLAVVYIGINTERFSYFSHMTSDNIDEDPEKFYSETFSKFYRLGLLAEKSGKQYVNEYNLDENYKNDPDVKKFMKFFESSEYKKACRNAYENLSEDDSPNQSLHQRWYSNLSCDSNQENWMITHWRK